VLTENIGDDAIEATSLGLKNIDRLLDKLVPATTRTGEDYSLLQDAYRAVLQHRMMWFGAVAKQVGGVVEHRTLGGRGGESFVRLPREQQQKAVKFLLDNAFQTPKRLIDPALVNRFKYTGVADEVIGQQRSLLTNLLGGRRFRLLLDAEVVNSEKSYSAIQLLNDVQEGIWSELKVSQPAVDAIRRGLHRSYLDHIKTELSPREPAAAPQPTRRRGGDLTLTRSDTKGTDFRAVARAALQDLAKQLEAAIPRAQDPMTRIHLQDCLREVKLILNPKE
jgi:hypothetical protein